MPADSALSARSKSIWAKSVYKGDPNDRRYLQLWQHLRDTAAVARRIWDEFLPDSARDRLISDLGGESQAVGLIMFLAMIHDVGKASPAFETQCDWLRDRVREQGLKIDSRFFEGHGPERSMYRHELVGYDALHRWFAENGYSTREGMLADGIASIVAGHHGTCITDEKKRLLGKLEAPLYVGDADWADVRRNIIDWAADETGFRAVLRMLDDRPLRCDTQITLTAVVIIADWIASDTWLFPLNTSELDEQCFDVGARVQRAWRLLNLPFLWQVSLSGLSADELFSERFGIPHARLRPVQYEAVHLAETMPDPGLMIIEANMGEGKTEAALLAAETLAGRFGCGGMYYALPTQTTANAMFHRILDWIGHLPAPEQGTLGSVFLSHGKREQNDEYFDLEERARDAGANQSDDSHCADYIVDDETQKAGENQGPTVEAVVNSWLSGRKRGNLSDFVLGTVDQALMMSLQCKHVVLRHLAFSGKVVIFDEIHSNTAYMNVYLETTLAWLGAYGTPVIMLSATLPQARREAFLKAYGRGAATRLEEPHEELSFEDFLAERSNALDHGADCLGDAELRQTPESGQRPQLDMRYPLISCVSGSGEPQTVAPKPSGRSNRVMVQRIMDDDETLVQLLRDRLADGGCAVVIRDTVARAQHAYDVLNEAFGEGIPVTLAHARYLACDRAGIDADLLKRFGKTSTPETRRGIVVATQVVEQSLDVDFDLMVSDAAPVDLILQRAGRLHRHRRGEGEHERPERLRMPQLYISGIESCGADQAPKFASGIERVYARFFLMRTVALMDVHEGEPTEVSLPADIPELVQRVYDVDTDHCPEAWRSDEQDARTKLLDHVHDSEEKAGQFRIFRPDEARSPYSLGSWLKMCMPDPDTTRESSARHARAAVRDGDDSFEVLVLQRDDAGNLCIPVWVDDSLDRVLSRDFAPPSREQIRKVLACSMTLGGTSLCWQNLDAVIAELESPRNTPRQWFELMQQNRELSGQLPLILDPEGNATLRINDARHRKTTQLSIHYSMEKGWEAHVEQ